VKNVKDGMAAFTDDFQRRGNDTLLLLLDDSETKLNAEKERYGLQKKEGRFSWLVGADYSMNDPGELTQAGKDLQAAYDELQVVTKVLDECKGLGGTLPPGGTEGTCTPGDRAQKEADVRAREKDYLTLRHEKEGKFPILVSFDLGPENAATPGTLATLASDSGDTKSELLYKQIDEKQKNIQTTRDHVGGHHDAIWKLPTIVGITQKLPDIAHHEKLPNQDYQKLAIDDATAKVELAEFVRTAAVAAIATGLGMLAGPVGAAGARGVALAMVATDAGLGVAQTLAAIHQYEVEAAETNTDLDAKAKSISQDEPSLFWLAVDIVMTVVQVKAAAEEFRALTKLSHAATAAKVAHNEEEATKLLDDLQEKGKKYGPEVGDRLRREATELGTSAAQDAGEIAANLESIVPSTVAGYTHEVPVGGGKFWRRTAEGRWCFFASPPRCPLDVADFMLSPTLAGLSPETTQALMDARKVLKLARQDVRVGELLERHGTNGVKAMDLAPLYGEDPLALLQRFDAVSHLEGADRLLADLAAGSTTTKGAIGELYYIDILLKRGTKIERIADVVGTKKAADIVLKNRTVVDVKYYDWTAPQWRSPAFVRAAADELVVQALRRQREYPRYAVVYVFGGSRSEIPSPIVKALEKAGAKVEGSS
jgi:hypothetical protein